MAIPPVSINDILTALHGIQGQRLVPVAAHREKVSNIINALMLIVRTDKMKVPRKPRARKSASPLQTLKEWESVYGHMHERMMVEWISQNRFCNKQISEMIDEFRLDMISKNKLYVDFVAAFKTYVNRGYLSKKRDQLKLVELRSVSL